MDMVNYLNTAQEHVRSLKDTRLAALRPLGDFFDWQRVSRPRDVGEFTKRAGYNIRYYSANYAIIFALLAVYALLTNPSLLFALVFLIGGFLGISRFVPEPIEFQGKIITPQNLYVGLFVIGVPLLFFSAPFATMFWLIGSSSCIIGAHAGFLEPGVESEYAGVEQV